VLSTVQNCGQVSIVIRANCQVYLATLGAWSYKGRSCKEMHRARPHRRASNLGPSLDQPVVTPSGLQADSSVITAIWQTQLGPTVPRRTCSSILKRVVDRSTHVRWFSCNIASYSLIAWRRVYIKLIITVILLPSKDENCEVADPDASNS
jgi:hypothetical protein